MKKLLSLCLVAFCFVTTKAQILNTNFCQVGNNLVYCTAVDSVNNIVYVGGSFTQICGQPRNKLAAMNLTTGALLSWNPGANNVVYSMYVHNGALYVGGMFTSIGGQTRNNAAKFYRLSNTAAAGWNAGIVSGTNVYSIVGKGNRIYIGGDVLITVGNGNQICELDTATGTPTPWSAYPNGAVHSLSIDGNSLYAGGVFTKVGAATQNYLAKFTLGASGGALAAWDPQPDFDVEAVCARSGRLFVGGGFALIGTDSREKLAEIDTSTALATSWNPGADNTVQGMEYRKGVVYPIGNFSVAGGKARSFIAAIDVNTGIATNWNAQVTGTINRTAIAQGQIFMGGGFGNVLGSPRTMFAVVCVNPIDTITNNPVGLTTVCNGLTGVTYSVAPVTGATSYVWGYTGTGATINGTTNSITVNFSSTATSGNITVKATNGCESSNTVSLAVSTYSFTTTVSPNVNSIICGDSVDINSSDNYQGGGTISYSWSPSTGLNTTNVYKVTSGSHSTQTYTLTETASDGCVAKDMTTITVSPISLITSSSFGNILCSTKDTLHVTNDYPGFGTVTYTWTPGASLNNTHSANPTANPVVSTTYTLTASATDGCLATAQTQFINVNDISVTAGSNSSSITCGDATILSSNNTYPGNGTVTYTWSPATGLSNANVSGPGADPIATTTYTLNITTPEGCQGSDQVTLVVNPLQVNVTNTVSAGCHQPVVLSTSANTSNSNLTYSWTPSTGLSSTTAANPTATIGVNTVYNVTMSLPSSGCASANNSVSMSLAPPAGLQICMVTVDSASTHNIVYWDKTGMPAIDSFRIYREITTGVYGIVGTVHFNALSEFHDFGANPNVTTYRYKISALDSCGNESVLSNYHNTVYIISVGNGQYTWNPGYTIEPSTNPVNNYLLMRDDNNNGSWHQVGSTSGSQNTLADPQWASYPNANWQVVTSWNISCTPTLRQSNGTLSAIVKSKSNISNNRTTTVKNTETTFAVYPNPTNGNVIIDLYSITTGKINIKVTSVIGEEVYNETLQQANGKHMIDLSKYQNGTYLVQITGANTSVVKRIIKN